MSRLWVLLSCDNFQKDFLKNFPIPVKTFRKKVFSSKFISLEKVIKSSLPKIMGVPTCPNGGYTYSIPGCVKFYRYLHSAEMCLIHSIILLSLSSYKGYIYYVCP